MSKKLAPIVLDEPMDDDALADLAARTGRVVVSPAPEPTDSKDSE